MNTNTAWDVSSVSASTAEYLCGTHKLWSRLLDGKHIWVALPIGTTPGPADDANGYSDIAAALKSKNLI